MAFLAVPAACFFTGHSSTAYLLSVNTSIAHSSRLMPSFASEIALSHPCNLIAQLLNF